MRVIELADGFGLDHLRLAERPDPAPGPGEVLIEIAAVSLNYRDLLTVRGHYNPKQKLPLIPCSDAVGRVLAVGDGVERVAVGDRVSPIFAQAWLAGEPTRDKLRSTLGGPLDGTLCERMVLSAEGVVPVPEHLTDEGAACLACAGVTAWNALAAGAVGPGDVVVAQGTGGVSTFALQLAQAAGARVVVTSSSDAKLERAREMGAWETINYREEPEWGERVRQLTGGRGADLVVEVGGAGTLEQSLRAVRFGGTISLIGVLSGARAPLAVTPILMKKVTVQGILVGDRESFEAMNRALAAHRIEPLVDRTLPLEDARRAFELMAAGEHRGKIVLAW